MASTGVSRIAGIDPAVALKAPCQTVATTNITLSGEQTVGGVAVLEVNASGIADRVLCTGQTDAKENGIWDVSTGAWTRSGDFNGSRDVVKGTAVRIATGTMTEGTVYVVSTANPIVIGTTEITFETRGALAGSDLDGALVTDVSGQVQIQDSVQSKVPLADLANDTDAAKGSDLVGHYNSVAPTFLQTVSDILNGDSISIFRFIDVAKHSAIKAFTNTDDLSTSFQSALDSGCRGINLSYGQFYIESALTATTNNFNMFGDGQSAAVLRSTQAITMLTVNAAQCTFKNFKFWGNGTSGTPGTTIPIRFNGVSGTGANDVDGKLHDVAVWFSDDGVHLNGRNLEIKRCEFATANNAIEVLDPGLSDYRGLDVINTRFHSIQGNAVYIDPAADFLEFGMVNNYMDGSTGKLFSGYAGGMSLSMNRCFRAAGGIAIDATGWAGSTDRRQDSIIGNVLVCHESNANTQHGIHIKGVDFFTLAANTLANFDYHGIYLESSNNNSIDSTRLYKVGRYVGGTYDGIHISASSSQNDLDANKVHLGGTNTRYAIHDLGGGNTYGDSNTSVGFTLANSFVLGSGLVAYGNTHIVSSKNRRDYASSIPTAGNWTKGDFVYNTNPSIDGNNMVLFGWMRLTTGAAHVSGTDWAVQYLSAVSPAT